MLLLAPLVANSAAGLPSEISMVIILFVKWSLIILASLYVLFALMVVKQIKIMRQTLVTSFSPILRLVGLTHLIVAITVLALFLFVL